MLCLLLGGCAVERGESSWRDQSVDASIADAGMGSDAAFGEGPGAGTMDGTWLLVHEGSTCVINDEQLTHAYYLVHMAQMGRVVSETRELCRVDLSPILGLKVLIPDAGRRAATFIDVDQAIVSDLRVGGSYTSSTELALWGLELDDPMRDELPTDAADPRVIDADQDGNPAITFEIENSDCRRFQGQRQVIRYTGTFAAPNAVEGSSVNLTDVKAYGSTSSLCGIAPPIVSNDAHSRFRMVRVDGAGGSVNLDVNGDATITCDEILPAVGQLIDERAASRENCARR